MGHGIHVKWLNGAQVDHLTGNTLRLQGLCRLQGHQDDLPRTGDGQVGTRSGNASHTKGDQVVSGGHLPTAGKEGFRLEHQNRITRAQGGFHQPFGIGRIGRNAHDEPRDVRPNRVIHAAVVGPGRAHGTSAGSDDHRGLHLSVAHVAQLGSLQGDLAGSLE